jgi:hypothetical protein
MAEVDLISDARNAIYAQIDAPSGITILEESEADRINWVKFLQNGYPGLTTPFLVVAWDRTVIVPTLGICNRVIKMPFRVVLVDDADRNAAARDSYYHTTLLGVEAAIRAGAGSTYQYQGQATIDSGPMSPSNRAIYEQNLPYHAAELSLEVVVGWSP